METLIRLSTAHAKARLSRVVEVEDADSAIEMVSYAYFKKVSNSTCFEEHVKSLFFSLGCLLLYLLYDYILIPLVNFISCI